MTKLRIPMTVGLLLAACSASDDPASDEVGTSEGTTEGETGPDTESGTATGSDTSEATTDSTETGDPPGNPLLSDELLNIAHRGGGLLRPEATLTAFENALAVGADVLEMDLHATSDGVIVVIHDDTVDRTTDGTGSVSELTFAELRMLDAGYDFTTDDGQTFPYRGMGIFVPTLDEVLDAFPDAHYLMEIKQSDPPIVSDALAILANHAVEDRVVLASFDDDTIEAVRAANPSLFTAMSAVEMAEFVAAMEDPSYQPPCLFFQSPWDITSQEMVDRAHALGMKVHPWTINTSVLMSDLIARGVDGIMTDDPDLLAQVVGDQ